MSRDVAEVGVCRSGIAKSTLQVWLRDSQLQQRWIQPAPSGDVDAKRERAKMLKRIRELEMENEVLRRARVGPRAMRAP